jgi:hypothetical protein
MEQLNPKSPAELEEQKSIDDFLSGDTPPDARPPDAHKHPQ